MGAFFMPINRLLFYYLHSNRKSETLTLFVFYFIDFVGEASQLGAIFTNFVGG